MDRAIAAAIKAVGNAIGENEEFICTERAVVAPNGKRTAAAVIWWRHRRDSLAIDYEPVASRVDAIFWARRDGFENVPILAGVAGTSAHVITGRRRNAKIHEFADGWFIRRAQIQAGCDARRCVDDDHALADDGWKGKDTGTHLVFSDAI